MAQLQDSFMLDDTELEGAQADRACEAANTETADKVGSTAAVADSSDVLAIDKEPAVHVAMSDNKLDELYQGLKSTSAAQPELRYQLVSQLQIARGIMERLAATSACGLAHPTAAPTMRQTVGSGAFLGRSGVCTFLALAGDNTHDMMLQAEEELAAFHITLAAVQVKQAFSDWNEGTLDNISCYTP